MRALEIKLSQGAKPGLGGVLPRAKVSAEISAARGVPRGEDCVSPSRHAEFSDVDEMLDWVEMLADVTGLPVGIKSAVGDLGFWHELVRLMAGTGRGVDHVTIDGGEGGTGAAPLVFADSVSLPFRLGFSRVYKIFAEAGLHERVVFVGSGKLGLPENAVVAFALGADLVNVGREAMLSIGCVQAQKCHTDLCPTGVTTQNPWLAHGLDPALKSVRCANYIRTLRRDLLKLAEATGVEHPGLIGCPSVEILTGQSGDAAGRGVRLRPGLGLPVGGGPRRRHPPDAGDRSPGRPGSGRHAAEAGVRIASRLPRRRDPENDQRGGGGSSPEPRGTSTVGTGYVAGGPASPARRAKSRSAAVVPIRRTSWATTVTAGDSRSAVTKSPNPMTATSRCSPSRCSVRSAATVTAARAVNSAVGGADVRNSAVTACSASAASARSGTTSAGSGTNPAASSPVR